MKLIWLAGLTLLACNNKMEFRDAALMDSSGVAQATIPAGAVLPFNSGACPAGWSEYGDAKGRFILGAGSGNTDGQGAALTARTVNQEGGREFTTGLPATTLAANAFALNSTSIVFAAANIYTSGTPDISSAASAIDSNMPPFIVRLFCKKSSAAASDLTAATIATAGSCQAGWADDAATAGRAILGQGTGNLDASLNPLTARVLNANGGVEHTPNIPLCVGLSSGAAPAPSSCLTGTGDGDLYIPDFPDTTIAGLASDSNMPPFHVLRMCANSTGQDLAPSGSVVAFDLLACPSGWSAFNALKGRIPFSANSVPSPTLSTRTIGTSGGLEYTTGLPVISDPAQFGWPTDLYVFARSIGFDAYRSATPDTTISGVKADSNLPPFHVLLYCEKD